MVGLTS